jgi:hypothetical protein
MPILKGKICYSPTSALRAHSALEEINYLEEREKFINMFVR